MFDIIILANYRFIAKHGKDLQDNDREIMGINCKVEYTSRRHKTKLINKIFDSQRIG